MCHIFQYLKTVKMPAPPLRFPSQSDVSLSQRGATSSFSTGDVCAPSVPVPSSV